MEPLIIFDIVLFSSCKTVEKKPHYVKELDKSVEKTLSFMQSIYTFVFKYPAHKLLNVLCSLRMFYFLNEFTDNLGANHNTYVDQNKQKLLACCCQLCSRNMKNDAHLFALSTC